MKILTKTVKAYKFAELSDDAKEKAVEKFRDINVDFDDWNDAEINDAKEIGALMGIDIENIYYSGFSSQGDGAQFVGNYQYKKGCVKTVKEYAPQDKELHKIVEALFELQKENNYSINASVEHSGHYYHPYCTRIDVQMNKYNESTEKAIVELLRDFMQWIYNQLEKSYNYLTSEKAIIETIEANDYDFKEDGTFPAI